MDYGTLRGLIALLIFVLFIIIVIWAYSKKQKSTFDEVANSILEDDNNDNQKRETNTND